MVVQHLSAHATPIHNHQTYAPINARPNTQRHISPRQKDNDAPFLSSLFRTSLAVAGAASINDDPNLQNAANLSEPQQQQQQQPVALYQSLYTAGVLLVVYGIVIMGRSITSPHVLKVFTEVDFYVWFCLLVAADFFLRMFYPKLVDQLAQAALFNIASLLMSPLKMSG